MWTRLAAIALLSAPIVVQAISGNELLNACKHVVNDAPKGAGPVEAYRSGIGFGKCAGYLQGFNDSEQGNVIINSVPPSFCFPDKVTVEQSARVIVRHLERNPEDLHKGAGGLVWDAFYDAFPCEWRKNLPPIER